MSRDKPNKAVKKVLDGVQRVVLGPVEIRDIGPSDREIEDLTEQQKRGDKP
jgi:hypothetical protein